MQENRSFDHHFGTPAGVDGFQDPNAITLSTGKSVFHQPDTVNPDGYLLPYHLDTRSTSAQWIPSTSHAWEVQHLITTVATFRSITPAPMHSPSATITNGFGDFITALRFNHEQAEPPMLPDTSGPLTLANYGVEQLQKPTFPSASQTPPKQEPGRRPRTR